MFGFKRRKKISLAINVLTECVSKLPIEFQYLMRHLSRNNIYSTQLGVIENYIQIVYKEDFRDKKKYNGILGGIKITSEIGKTHHMSMYIGDGVIDGYILTPFLWDLKIKSINLDELEHRNFPENTYYSKIAGITENFKKHKWIDTDSFYDISFKGKRYISLLELDDGDLIIVDLETTNTYKLTHDPFEIDLLGKLDDLSNINNYI